MKRGKIWGTTELLLAIPVLEIHRLSIKRNAQCSMHAHKFKWNAFFVQKGKLSIIVEKNDYSLTDETVLGPGEFTTVKPGEYHRFKSHGEPVLAIELYYPETLSEDIVRKDCGKVLAGRMKKRKGR